MIYNSNAIQLPFEQTGKGYAEISAKVFEVKIKEWSNCTFKQKYK